jgi:hypothetical protein
VERHSVVFLCVIEHISFLDRLFHMLLNRFNQKHFLFLFFF